MEHCPASEQEPIEIRTLNKETERADRPCKQCSVRTWRQLVALLLLQRQAPRVNTQCRFTNDHTKNITGTTDGSGETFTLYTGAIGPSFRVFPISLGLSA